MAKTLIKVDKQTDLAASQYAEGVTAAIAAVQSDVDGNEADADAAIGKIGKGLIGREVKPGGRLSQCGCKAGGCESGCCRPHGHGKLLQTCWQVARCVGSLHELAGRAGSSRFCHSCISTTWVLNSPSAERQVRRG